MSAVNILLALEILAETTLLASEISNTVFKAQQAGRDISPEELDDLHSRRVATVADLHAEIARRQAQASRSMSNPPPPPPVAPAAPSTKAPS